MGHLGHELRQPTCRISFWEGIRRGKNKEEQIAGAVYEKEEGEDLKEWESTAFVSPVHELRNAPQKKFV